MQAGAALASLARAGDCITLSGPLGAGKTTLARGFIRALAGAETEVASPTFALSLGYDCTAQGGACTLAHYDLYRLKRADELEELGFSESLAGIVLVEWPEIAEDHLPQNRLSLRLATEENHRLLLASVPAPGHNDWPERLKRTGIFT